MVQNGWICMIHRPMPISFLIPSLSPTPHLPIPTPLPLLPLINVPSPPMPSQSLIVVSFRFNTNSKMKSLTFVSRTEKNHIPSLYPDSFFRPICVTFFGVKRKITKYRTKKRFSNSNSKNGNSLKVQARVQTRTNDPTLSLLTIHNRVMVNAQHYLWDILS